MERIVLAFAKDATAQKMKRMIDNSGYDICRVCHSSAELLRTIAELDDILIIMGYKINDTMADDVSYELNDTQKLMAIVKAEHIDVIENEDIFIMPLPINRETFINAIELQIGYIEKPRGKAERSPEEQSIIMKAKLYLIEKYQMTEDQAHRFIQKRSMDTGSKFVDTAKLILHI